ncbi:MAG: hypothetical protein C0467_05990 [Planctomycetaceae bacterium]|nr:hypothetical protein [Planctomycetaceae bacterium]
MTTSSLVALQDGLRANDQRLVQGVTTVPCPLASPSGTPVEGACLVGYCEMMSKSLGTVGEVEESFADLCFEADQRLGEPAACRWFLNWFDDTDREIVRTEMLAEVELALSQRTAQLTPSLKGLPCSS